MRPVVDGDAAVYYAVRRNAMLYSTPDSTRPYVQLSFREPVFVLAEQGDWRLVRTRDGARGYAHASTLSNVWILVSKRRQTLYVYRGGHQVRAYPVDLGQNFFADKVRRGSRYEPDHWRTPDGVFFVASKNPRSQFYRALVLNYPTAEDAERGLREGLITPSQYEAILRAEREFRMPPMNTALGGWIEIHGDGTGARSNWTQGCVAVLNRHMDELWELVEVGTPVLIEP
ncbi:L,D-transpeptidase family protein [Rhodocaloribacter litoris]|nr:L,D-transpeptidase family protein [Rhodocaloribacter litoris]